MKKLLKTIVFLLSVTGMASVTQAQTGSETIPPSPEVTYALSVVQTVQTNNRWVSNLAGIGKSRLPVGIKDTVAGSQVIIAIDTARLTPQGATFNAYAGITFPQTNHTLAFRARNLVFTPGGIGGGAQTQLVLVSEELFNVFPNVKLHLPANGSNYIEWDCNGFRDVHLKGEFIFDSTLIVPDSLSGAKQVTAAFEVIIKDPNNFLITTSISPFTLTQNRELSFAVTQLTADFSDIANPPDANFPSVYRQQYGSDINLWRGFYIKDLTVRLPSFLSTKSGRTTIRATDFIIDDQGVSGNITATDLFSTGECTTLWPISVESLNIQLVQSRLIGGGLGGHLKMPFLGGDSLKYFATIAENTQHDWDYHFLLQLDGNARYGMPFGGTLTLNKNSSIQFDKVSGKISGSATLNGELDINESVLNIQGIKFQDLVLTTDAPYLVNGVFDFKCNNARLSNFPISFSSLNLGIHQEKFRLGCVANMNLMNASDNTPSCSVGFYVNASVKEQLLTGYSGISYTQHTFSFDGIDVDEIKIDNLHISALTINGGIKLFKDNPTFGNGFRGSLSLTIGNILKNPVSVQAVFGSTSTLRYYHFDISALVGKIPMFPGLFLSGIMGGVSYHMTNGQTPSGKPDLRRFNEMIAGDTVAITQKQSASILSAIENYLPDSTTGLHLMAGVMLEGPSKKAFNANALLELAFRSGGSLKYIQFTGYAYLLQNVQLFNASLSVFNQNVASAQVNTNESPQSMFWAGLVVLYDNDNQVFDADLQAYLNIANIIKGANNGIIGNFKIHFDPKDWYIYVGTSVMPIGLEIANLAKATGYFMVGTKILPIQAPPQQVANILGEDMKNLDISSYLQSFASGRGFAFGARIQVNINVNPVPFFASIQAGAGADIMLQQYVGVHCKGSSENVGWNGWYATGQSFAYLQASAGIKVGRRKFCIFSAGLAALLQAQLPHPSWFKGEFGGTYSVLFGLVRGRFKIKFTIGDQCELVSDGSEIGDIQVIEDIKPADRTTGVDVFAYPQASFNIGIGQEIPMLNETTGKMENYRIKLDDCLLKNGSQIVPGSLQWNSTNDVVSVNTPDVLPPQQTLSLYVKIHWEKKVSGVWQPLMNGNGTPDTEEKSISFTTGTAPTTIPETNIAYSYPVKQQYNFHPEEYGNGYMQLKRGQPYLFTSSDSNGTYNYVARFTPSNGSTPAETSLSYNDGSRNLQFSIPHDMALGTIYNLDFVRKPMSTATPNDRNAIQTTSTTGDEDNSVNVTTKSLAGTITQSIEQDIYNSFYRTSNYATFNDKWNSMNNAQDLFDIAQGNLYVIAKRTNISETFDEVELFGKDSLTPSMIQPVALASPDWYNSIQNPLLYQLYGTSGLYISWREANDKGIGPLKAVTLSNMNTDADYTLSNNDLQNGFANARGGSLLMGYYLSYYAFRDFIDLRNAAANKYINGGILDDAAKRLLNAKGYTDLLPGQYPVQFQYILPGTKKVTTTEVVNIKF